MGDSMTLADLRTLVLTWLDDPGGGSGYFTTPQVDVFINNAARQVQKKLIQSGELWFSKSVQTTTVVNTESYTLPTDFLRLHRAEIIMPGGTYPNQDIRILQVVTPVQRTLLPQGTGTPAAYWINKGYITLVKCPDQAYTLQLLYSYLIADMTTSTESPDIPEQYHEMIAIYATLDGFLKDQRDPNPVFSQKLGMYEEMMKQDSQNRNLDQPRMVVETGIDNGGAYFGW
jgi:hypothetical protein